MCLVRDQHYPPRVHDRWGHLRCSISRRARHKVKSGVKKGCVFAKKIKESSMQRVKS